jgi:hypothetical protein
MLDSELKRKRTIPIRCTGQTTIFEELETTKHSLILVIASQQQHTKV